MLPSTIRSSIVSLFIILGIYNANGLDRKIISKLNPGCRNCNSTTLIYIQAIGSEDVIHQLWDFTRGIPTIIYAIGTVNSTIRVYWGNDAPTTFSLSETPKYSFAAAMDMLYEYDDVKDKGYIEPSDPQKYYSFDRARWQRKEMKLSDSEAAVVMRGHLPRKQGVIDIKFDLLPYEDYASDLPHLIHTANSTLVDISLVNITSSSHYNASRYALHFVLVGTDNSSDSMHYAMRKSLDDEHTPGVFEIVEIKTPESFKNQDGGFMQFRPVGYTQMERGVTTSVLAHVSGFNKTMIPGQSTLDNFYVMYQSKDLLVQDIFISFGEPGDGYYSMHNYTAWSFTIGYGSPPLESVSLFVIIIICIGLAVPILLALSGVTYVVVRKYRSRNAPTRFTDDY